MNGMSKLEAAYYSSAYWKEVRKAVYERDGAKCSICESPYNLHVHHLTYAHARNELEYLGDLTLLCGSCHNQVHAKDREPQERLCPFCGDGRLLFPCDDCVEIAEECGYRLGVEALPIPHMVLKPR
jgi:hypothetical protein